MNHHASRGYRFEMEVLGAFKAAEVYVAHQDDMRMIAGDVSPFVYFDSLFFSHVYHVRL